MATQSIYVDWMKCITSSDSSDDIYLLMFRGRTDPPFNNGVALKGPGNFWTDFDDGELWNQDILMVQFFPDAVYGVIMVERDSGKDITPGHLSTIKTACDGAWKGELGAQQLAGNPPSSKVAKAAAFAKVQDALFGLVDLFCGAPNDPDDIIGPNSNKSVQRLFIAPGQNSPPLTFKGQGAHYEVKFKVASP
jgi:hypothetical protein